MKPNIQKLEFEGSKGAKLAARLDLPAGNVRAYALFAHCFTCSKDIFAAARIANGLSRQGFAVLRFDFTGLGASDGEFAHTNFSSNVDDLVVAADYLREHFGAPEILVGHSLGGAAVLAAADRIDEVKAVVTIGAPSDAEHVIHNFGAKVDEIEEQGEAEVELAGRPFKIQKQFLEDVRATMLEDTIAGLKRPLLVMHAPLDETVGIENASHIFTSAKHPKSFISLDDADHLLTKKADAIYAANMIAAWVSKFVGAEAAAKDSETNMVHVAETGEGKFQQTVQVGRHRLVADEPESYGGLDTGPTPYDFLSIALGACTSMTMRLYAERKKWPVKRIAVDVDHAKVHADDCEGCEDKNNKIDEFIRTLHVEGDLDDDQMQRMVEIADKCPVHRTLEQESRIKTQLAEAADA